MALHRSASFSMAACLAIAVCACSADRALSAECKRKTAGFYLLDASLAGNRPVSFPPQSIPFPLTGTIGDPERGRQLLVSKQKSGCLSCHKLSTIGPDADQGGIGAPWMVSPAACPRRSSGRFWSSRRPTFPIR